jgi:hypothetical protein
MQAGFPSLSSFQIFSILPQFRSANGFCGRGPIK